MWLTTLSMRNGSAYLRSVATFVIETYLSRTRSADLDRVANELRDAAARARATDPRIRHVRSYFVADDEIAYHVVEASSAETVEELSRAAGLTPDRIVEAATG
jgi:hypothetical protein